MNYPTLEQYTEALQSPNNAFIDPELKNGVIATSGLGLPLALCGGFALTYTVSTSTGKYAVRCFHRKSNELERRYLAISNKLNSLTSPYFVPFQFQKEGIRVNGTTLPIVKMKWASGETLGEFLEANHSEKSKIIKLTKSFFILADFLEKADIAHGDIQPGNVMVSSDGSAIQLIDYDGMYVEPLSMLGSAELGHRNFQHPKRSQNTWSSKLDRFSLITILLALRLLELHPELWEKTNSDADAVIFRANDFLAPNSSPIFKFLKQKSFLGKEIQAYVSICASEFNEIPSVNDFVNGRVAVKEIINISTANPPVLLQYNSPYPVLDAASYETCLAHVGDRVEIIGKVFDIKHARTKYGLPYTFVNFGPWKGKIFKITIWSEGLKVIKNRPETSWVGKWVSVVGLLEPPFHSNKLHYTHISITITQSNQMHIIPEDEARYRLNGKKNEFTLIKEIQGNDEVLEGMRKRVSRHIQTQTGASVFPIGKAPTANETVLQQMQSLQSGSSSSMQKPYSPQSQPTVYQPAPSKTTQENSGLPGCFWFLVITALLWFMLKYF